MRYEKIVHETEKIRNCFHDLNDFSFFSFTISELFSEAFLRPTSFTLWASSNETNNNSSSSAQ